MNIQCQNTMADGTVVGTPDPGVLWLRDTVHTAINGQRALHMCARDGNTIVVSTVTGEVYRIKVERVGDAP